MKTKIVVLTITVTSIQTVCDGKWGVGNSFPIITENGIAASITDKLNGGAGQATETRYE